MELRYLLLAILVLSFSVNCAEKARYDNYRIYEIIIENDEQLELLKDIENNSYGYEVMRFPNSIDKKVEILVPPHKLGEFSEIIENFQFKSQLLMNNLQEIIDNEQPKERSSRLDWTRYWTLTEITSWLKQLVANQPDDLQMINIGTSHEGRPILGVKLNIGNGTGKKQIILEGTMHAREWISTATVTWILNELLTSEIPEIKVLAANYEWIILPVINVDGYEYSWTSDRMWRKTRQRFGRLCVGVDPNRNFDNFFNQAGTSPNPCRNTYAGPFPFSEPETKQYSEFMANLPNLAGYFSFHSFGQMLLLPYGYTQELLDNYDELYEIGQKAVAALRVRYRTRYRLGSIANVLYYATGNSLDWLKYNYQTNVTYVYELRDRGLNRFILPASQIIPNCLEVFDSLFVILTEAQKKGIA
ncbi:unnamed protein product [Chironomus riparius]|uniref:Zinc carboxypeptidase A 1 n=1 Tax=Chironomus riparius TaxID=315576 RepID=A0A9N9RXU4_9DIPT|nr:unnamed protein product [Chironomus riparius]